MDASIDELEPILGGPEGLEATLVELIVAATECSEDETEVADLVDGLLASGRVRLVAEAPLRTRSHSWQPLEATG